MRIFSSSPSLERVARRWHVKRQRQRGRKLSDMTQPEGRQSSRAQRLRACRRRAAAAAAAAVARLLMLLWLRRRWREGARR
jgi:hypothetical protein